MKFLWIALLVTVAAVIAFGLGRRTRK